MAMTHDNEWQQEDNGEEVLELPMALPTFSPVLKPQTVMDFPYALRELMLGKKVTKLEWGNPDIYLVLVDKHPLLHSTDGLHQLILSDGDLFGEDWIVTR